MKCLLPSGLLAFLLLFALSLPPTANAARRSALIIGVNEYPDDSRFPSLHNPVSDAELIAKTLSRCGFAVTFVKNPTYGQMRAYLSDWVQSIDAGGDAIFYFSGHGIEHEKTNFLMGSNALFQSKFELGEEGLKADTVVAGMLGREPKSALLFLDCCRENPDAAWLASGATRGVKEVGLGNMAHPDIVIAYSAAPGRVSLDGPRGGNSPYAHALANAMRSGAELEQVFKLVRREVHVQTSGTQRTWETGSFLHDFYFEPEAAPADTPSKPLALPHPYLAGDARRMPGDLLSISLEKDLAMTFAWCPPGDFMRGSPPDEDGRYADEPQARVRLSEGFWLGRTEVTQAQYEAILGKQPSQYGNRPNAPVEQLTWEEAAAFCVELNRRFEQQLPEGYRFALPSEAQWEYACRAGTQGSFLGSLPQFAWFGGSLDDGPSEVALKEPNAWGLHDMQGNVWEWCQDWYAPYALGDAEDPTGATGGSYRIYRGGGFSSVKTDCRPANRSAVSPESRFGFLGLRVAIRTDA